MEIAQTSLVPGFPAVTFYAPPAQVRLRERVKRQRIAIALDGDSFSCELYEAIHEELGYRGHEVRRLDSQATFAEPCDLIVLINGGSSTDALLRNLPPAPQRPRIVLWNTESLPPPDLHADTERLAMDITGWKWDGPHPLWDRLKPLLPRRKDALRALRTRQLQPARQGGGQQDPFHGVDADQVHLLMGRWQWIRSHLAERLIDRVVVTTSAQAEFLRSRGVQAELAPIGFHPRFGTPAGDPDAVSNYDPDSGKWVSNKDIDVLCFGGPIQGDRDADLPSIHDMLAARGIKLVPGAADGNAVERERQLRRAKIVLHLAPLPWEADTTRLMMAMACKAMVVSQAVGDPRPFRPGEHFAQCSMQQLPEAIAWHLDRPEKCEAMASAAYSFVSRQLTLKQSFAGILQT